MARHVAFGSLLAFTLSACAAIQTYERLEQPQGRALTTRINGTVFRVSRTSDLPNAFGKADAFGGKVDRGFTELRYVGLADDGRLVLRLTDLETKSSETTMSRYGVGRSYATATSSGTGRMASASGIYIPPPKGSTEALPPNTVEFLYDRDAGPLVLDNVEVTFLDATDLAVSYVVYRRPRSAPSAAPAG